MLVGPIILFWGCTVPFCFRSLQFVRPNIRLSSDLFDSFEHSSDNREAAIYTPYHLTPGGGEKYLLTTVQSLQMSGYRVVIYVDHSNVVQTLEGVLQTAAALQVHLRSEILSLSLWSSRKFNYDIFWALGNSKHPMVRPIGQISLYMCQFPFDLDALPSRHDLKLLSLYDVVLLNSFFTRHHYDEFMSLSYQSVLQAGALLPHVQVLHPPATLYSLSPQRDTRRTDIILVGRLFSGRQSKGHGVAIKMFCDSLMSFPDTHLHLVGQLVTGHEDYLKNLRRLAECATGRIQFHVSTPSERLIQLYAKSRVLWHLTGIDTSTVKDPASLEHFGISIVEGMSAGVVPVVWHGGATDFIHHGVNGFLAKSQEDVVKYTKYVFANSSTAFEGEAIETSHRFKFEIFHEKLTKIFVRARLDRVYRYYISQTTVLFRSLVPVMTISKTSSFAAVIIEPRIHYAHEWVMLNTFLQLSASGLPWRFFAMCSVANEALLRSFRTNVVYETLPIVRESMTIEDYNMLLMSASFWRTFTKFKRVLTFQVDSVILQPTIQPRFLANEYIGAPWHPENERWVNITKYIPDAIGNGGFSIRDPIAMIRIIRNFKRMGSENEDIFFARHSRRETNRQIAYSFCLEVTCTDLENVKPYALHATWYYVDENSAIELFLSLTL